MSQGSEIVTVSTLTELLDDRAHHGGHGSRLAYGFLANGEFGGETITYAQLRRKALRMASLVAQHAEPGGRVVLVYPPSLDFIVAFLGCLYAGAIAVPVYPPAPPKIRASALHLERVLADSAATLVLTDLKYLELGQAMPALESVLTHAIWLTSADCGKAVSTEWPGTFPVAETVAFLQYTSGSTAQPKGVVLTHRNLMANLAAIEEITQLRQSDVGVSWLPMYHDMGLIGCILEPLYVGFPCYFMSPHDFLRRPARWLEAISKLRATCAAGPNFGYELCLKRISEDDIYKLDLSSWKLALNGAEPIKLSTMQRFAEKFGPAGFRGETFATCYGLAEASLLVTGTGRGRGISTRWVSRAWLSRERAVAVRADAPDATQLVSSGKPPSCNEVVIAEPQGRQQLPDGAVGEICVRGPSVGRGYWSHEYAAGSAFAQTIDGIGEGFLRTGDLGFALDGDLYVTGRIKDLIIVRGRNVYPQDIELAAQLSHRNLRLGCGAAFNADIAGTEMLVFVQETASTDPAELDDLITGVRAAVYGAQQVHLGAVLLVAPSTLPKTSSGKLRRSACRAEFLGGELQPVARWFAPQPDGGDRQMSRVITHIPSGQAAWEVKERAQP